MTCTACQRAITPLEVFPGDICVDCYAQTPEANAPLTAEELARVWGGR